MENEKELTNRNPNPQEQEINVAPDTEKEKTDVNTKTQQEFISSEILLNMVMDEYAKERERTNALDNKASFFMTILTAVGTIFVPIFPFGKLRYLVTHSSDIQANIVVDMLIVAVFALSFLIMAFLSLYEAYKLTDFKRPSLKCIDDEIIHKARKDQVKKGLCDHYKTVVDYNIAVNNQKCDCITKGIRFCGIGLLLMIISTIVLRIMIGD